MHKPGKRRRQKHRMEILVILGIRKKALLDTFPIFLQSRSDCGRRDRSGSVQED